MVDQIVGESMVLVGSVDRDEAIVGVLGPAGAWWWVRRQSPLASAWGLSRASWLDSGHLLRRE